MKRVLLAAWLFAACEAPVAVQPLTGRTPAAPAGLTISPSKGPSSRRHVKLAGVAPPGTAVRIYASRACAGEPLVVTTATDLLAGVPVDAVADSVNVFSATALSTQGAVSECSAPVSYEHRSGLALAPQLVGFAPAPPSPVTSPKVIGRASPGDLVQIFATAACGGAPIATGSDAAFAAGIEVQLHQDANTWISADALRGEEESDCSGALLYVNDTIPPQAPTLRLNTGSPSSDPWPMVAVSGPEWLESVLLFRGTDCTGAPLSTYGTNWNFGGVWVAMDWNSVTTFAGQAVDLAGNRSSCGPALSYQHDDRLPPWIPQLNPAYSWTGQANFSVQGQPESLTEIFSGADCQGALLRPPTMVPEPPAGTLTLAFAADAGEQVTISVRSATVSGARSGCSNAATVLVP